LKSKDKGGMGIRDLRKQNNSLLMKCLWRYNEEGQALWKDVIRSKYGEYNPWCNNVSVDAYGVGVWRLSETYGKNLKLIRTLKWEMAGELSFGQMRGTNRFL